MMKHAHYPAPRTLFFVWLTLMAATGITMIAGKVTGVASLGLLWAAVLMAITWLKANLVLAYFLDLKSATKGWNKAFTILVTIIIVIVYGLYTGARL